MLQYDHPRHGVAASCAVQAAKQEAAHDDISITYQAWEDPRMAEHTISAQVSIYPLRQERLTPAIAAVRVSLEAHGLRTEVGPMSTQVTGSAETLFAALGEAFVRAAAIGQVVMTITVSNACPVPEAAQ
jgi:uncharacterized protein YqgV (UPF0045/DUF77 family)